MSRFIARENPFRTVRRPRLYLGLRSWWRGNCGQGPSRVELVPNVPGGKFRTPRLHTPLHTPINVVCLQSSWIQVGGAMSPTQRHAVTSCRRWPDVTDTPCGGCVRLDSSESSERTLNFLTSSGLSRHRARWSRSASSSSAIKSGGTSPIACPSRSTEIDRTCSA